MSANEIKVSICCLVYNHEKYLRKCLDGFVTQKTNFKFEILIHDDASTDASADIIREYEKKYPHLIKPIYQKENQYSKGIRINKTYQYPRAKGKYIALCEGDDYWCYEYKLQEQYDEMESNRNAAICVHKVEIIQESGETQNRYIPSSDINDKYIESDKMMEIIGRLKYPFQTSSYFFKRSLLEDVYNCEPAFYSLGGDIAIILYMITKGSYIYINKIMSCYRRGAVGSWISLNSSSERQIILSKNTIAMYLLYDIYTKKAYEDIIRGIIEQQMFYICQLSGDYRRICKLRKTSAFKEQTLMRKLYYHLCAVFPGISTIYKKIYNKC